MLDSPSTGAEDPVVFNAVCLRTALQLTLVFQKRYLLDHLRLQIVGLRVQLHTTAVRSGTARTMVKL